MKRKKKYYNHLVRGIPNNFITRWLAKKANDLMISSDSRWELKVKYRMGRKGGKRSCSHEVKRNEGKVFSVYVYHRPGYASYREEKLNLLPMHNNELRTMKGGTYV
tara:strand:- start:4235 stop:4552 length:318 start_codon:yes stop_codon:yes gene_type:complete